MCGAYVYISFCCKKEKKNNKNVICNTPERYQVNQVLHQFSSLVDHYAKLHNSLRPIYVSIIIQTSIRFFLLSSASTFWLHTVHITLFDEWSESRSEYRFLTLNNIVVLHITAIMYLHLADFNIFLNVRMNGMYTLHNIGIIIWCRFVWQIGWHICKC